MNLALIILILRWIGAGVMVIDLIKSIFGKLEFVKDRKVRAELKREAWQCVWKRKSAKPRQVSQVEADDMYTELSKIHEKLNHHIMRG